jgi:hypothetical protein
MGRVDIGNPSHSALDFAPGRRITFDFVEVAVGQAVFVEELAIVLFDDQIQSEIALMLRGVFGRLVDNRY